MNLVNQVDDCYKVSILLATYSHFLNPTLDKDCCPKSNQGLIITSEVVNKNRGKKPLLRRKDVGKEKIGFTKGRVSKKGVKMKCNIYGVQGHNKRYHGLKVLCITSFFSSPILVFFTDLFESNMCK